MRKYLYYLLILQLLVGVSSCGGNDIYGCPTDYYFYDHYFMTFYLQDRLTGETLLELGDHRYIRNEVLLLSEDLEPILRPDKNGSFDLFFLSLPEREEDPLGEPLSHTYYLFLEEGDYDTLNITYTIGINECDDKALTHWTVSYNDSTYLDLEHPTRGKTIYVQK